MDVGRGVVHEAFGVQGVQDSLTLPGGKSSWRRGPGRTGQVRGVEPFPPAKLSHLARLRAGIHRWPWSAS